MWTISTSLSKSVKILNLCFMNLLYKVPNIKELIIVDVCVLRGLQVHIFIHIINLEL